MDSPSQQAALKRRPPFHQVGRAGYIVTNEMYSTLYDLYYQRCARQRVPCLVIVRHGSHCRLDLDMTCSNLELTDWGRLGFEKLVADIPVDEVYSDDVYFWATRVPNRMSDRLARGILTLLCDERASRPA
jgi:hypothetical protein